MVKYLLKTVRQFNKTLPQQAEEEEGQELLLPLVIHRLVCARIYKISMKEPPKMKDSLTTPTTLKVKTKSKNNFWFNPQPVWRNNNRIPMRSQMIWMMPSSMNRTSQMIYTQLIVVVCARTKILVPIWIVRIEWVQGSLGPEVGQPILLFLSYRMSMISRWTG